MIILSPINTTFDAFNWLVSNQISNQIIKNKLMPAFFHKGKLLIGFGLSEQDWKSAL